MRVLVYPEKTYETLGAERWEISYETVRPGCQAQIDAGQDLDYDCDIIYRCQAFKTRDAAVKHARKLVKDGVPYFGAVCLTRQVVDWFVREDNVAEWTDIGASEEISD